jgi:myo-inositol-1(or 4)-monophosphatase
MTLKKDYINLIEFIIEALNSVSKIANRNFGRVSSTVKSTDANQVLTKTDLEVGDVLIGRIREAFTNHNIIDEEAGVINNQSEYTWVIDPIDGTSNFAEGVPLYGTMIGLLQDDIPVVGGIALPFFSEVCVAAKGMGAWCNNTKLRVSNATRLLSTLVAYGIDANQEDPGFTKQECEMLAEIILNVRNIRSSNSVFDAVMLAKGKYGGLLNRTSRIWDNVAQQVLIEEAGGAYTDFFGGPVDYSDPLSKVTENYTFCAAPPVLHTQLQKIILGS